MSRDREAMLHGRGHITRLGGLAPGRWETFHGVERACYVVGDMSQGYGGWDGVGGDISRGREGMLGGRGHITRLRGLARGRGACHGGHVTAIIISVLFNSTYKPNQRRSQVSKNSKSHSV